MIFVMLLFALASVAVGAAQDNRSVFCETTKGNILIELRREWAPLGHDRFVELVESGFFTDQIIYRAIPGVAASPDIQNEWNGMNIKDDTKLLSKFRPGSISFAGRGPHTRTTHIFFALEPHGLTLGNAAHERPFGRVKKGLDVLNSFYTGYGEIEGAQEKLLRQGNDALKNYPLLDRIKSCRFMDRKDFYESPHQQNGNAQTEPPATKKEHADPEPLNKDNKAEL